MDPKSKIWQEFMTIQLYISFILLLFIIMACSNSSRHDDYTSFSRLTDPKNYEYMLDELPDEVIGICEIAEQQTVHRNLLTYFGIPAEKWTEMNNIWPTGAAIPGMSDMLRALKMTDPKTLYAPREVNQRLIGACMTESIFLTGLLRYKNIPARIRAGYFKDTMIKSDHVISFWEDNVRGKGIREDLMKENPQEWKKLINEITRREQIEVNKHIEHWVCEYWDGNENKWRVLDANTSFLKASSDIEVGYHLPLKHFQYAFAAWKKMRTAKNFNPDQYAEYPYDGRSHIRSQLILDYYCLLNHDMAGFDNQSGQISEFVKRKPYKNLSQEELFELDALAEMLAREPSVNELVSFYHSSKTLLIDSAEEDPNSLVFKK
jgi:hypothetical protein